MGVTYRGVTDEYVLQKAEPRYRAMEMPSICETWAGPLGDLEGTLRDAFVNAVQVGQPYNGGYLTDVTSREKGIYAEVDRIVGYPPDTSKVTVDGGFPKKSASFSATVNQNVASGNVTLNQPVTGNRKLSFYSPTTKYIYFALQYPNGPRYSSVNGNSQPVIVASVMTASSGGQTLSFPGATAPSALVTALTMPVLDVLDDFDPVQIPGTPWYKVTEVWARVYTSDSA